MADTAEQQARDLLERLDVENAQHYTAGDIVELANLIADHNHARRQLAAIRRTCTNYTPDPSLIDAILDILDNPL